MPKKILVTTDLSAKSKAALRFAIALCRQHEYELTVFHSYYVMKPTSWTAATFREYEKKESGKIQKRLDKFVQSVFKAMKEPMGKTKCVINDSVYTDKNIMDYAKKNEYDFICISTRGAGKLKKLIGTNTSNLIIHSHVPVIAVPHNYKSSKISEILYASDLKNLKRELKLVVSFAKPIDAKVELLHFGYPAELVLDTNVMKKVVNKMAGHKIDLHLENLNEAESLIDNIEKAIKVSKPSMIIMFTQQNRGFFMKMFSSSRTRELSFHLKIPMLVFNKS